MTQIPAQRSTAGTPSTPAVPLVERRTIDMVPLAERHGRPLNQFTLWFGANMQISTVVTGALAVILGASGLTALLGLAIGNVLGGAFMALHSAQGPRLGLPQMISSRAQFGVRGASLPLILVILMYLGFASTSGVLAGQAVNLVLHLSTPSVGIVVFFAITLVIAVFGYRWIHALGRVATVFSLVVFAFLFVRLFTQYDLSALFTATPFGWVPFVTGVTLAAGWQMTYAPYVADYSRYLPPSTPARATFWWTFSGSVIGAQIAMTFGALIALVGGDAFLENQVGSLGRLAGAGIAAFVVCLVIIVGFVLVSAVISLVASADFLSVFKNFVLLLLAVFIPWSVINLTDYYLVSKERVDIPALYTPRGRYGSVNVAAIVGYVVGILVQIPFLSRTMYTGPLAKAMGGLDLSWLVALIVTFTVYYPWSRRASRHPEAMVYPAQDEESAVTPRG